MRIGVFGDIHGNVEALKAAYEAALAHGAERLYHLGDLGGYAPFVNEVVDFMAKRSIEGVMGNYDEAVANDREHCGCKYENPLQAEMAEKSFEWTKAHASERSKQHMKGLPTEISFEAEVWRVKLFHAAPHKLNLYWFEDRPEKFFAEMAARADADVLIYGHTHIPYRRDIGGKVFINAGSVGKPKDGDPRACVALVDLKKGEVGAELLRVAYDVDKVASDIVESGLPPYFADKLRSGR